MAEPFKNRIDATAVQTLASRLASAARHHGVPFSESRFVDLATQDLADLELKARVHHVADTLQQTLGPASVSELRPVLIDASGPPLPTGEGVSDGFELWPLLAWVRRHALHDPEAALPLLEALTSRFSAEFAIRPFLRQWPDLAWPAVLAWTTHEDLHVRRLASEGTRPRLPWGEQLQASLDDPSRGLAVLDRLVDDPELYVRRSVANHLGDIAKDHPTLAVEVAQRWLTERPDREWVVRHGLRHLFKQGHSGALAVLGYGPPRVATADSLTVSPHVRLGDAVDVSITLSSTAPAPQALMIDVGLHFIKSNGQRRPKVFKWTTRTLAPGEALPLRRSFPLKPVSTRRHHPGQHAVDIRVNGVVVGLAEFWLECEPGE